MIASRHHLRSVPWVHPEQPCLSLPCPRSYECAVTTLAAFIREQRLSRIDLLKIDVEGSELAVLRGLDAAGWATVRQLVAEVHDVGGVASSSSVDGSPAAAPAGGGSSASTGGCGGRVAEVQRLLEARGFAVHTEEQAGLPGNFLVFAWALS